jgi:excisionase family DNA binding protein
MRKKKMTAAPDAILLTPGQAGNLLGIGRTSMYDLLKAGVIPSVDLFGIKVCRTDLDKYVEKLKLKAEMKQQ